MPVATLAKGVVVFKREMAARILCDTVFAIFSFSFMVYLVLFFDFFYYLNNTLEVRDLEVCKA